jgi:hypothetical protein
MRRSGSKRSWTRFDMPDADHPARENRKMKVDSSQNAGIGPASRALHPLLDKPDNVLLLLTPSVIPMVS